VFSLAQALLFSLLYGAEFLGRMEVIQRCEAAWWSGVRKFYGLPNGVSNATLHLLFPRFSLTHRVLLSKVALSLRAVGPLNTLLPEAIIFDRGFLFERHRMGFLQVIKDWGMEIGLPDLYSVSDKGKVTGLLWGVRQGTLDGTWDTFARMPSTRLVASLVGDRGNFYEVSLAASKLSRLGLHIFLLAVTGSLAQSYLKARVCYNCGEKYTFEHFISCPFLGPDLLPLFKQAGDSQDWDAFVSLVVSCFQVFLHSHRGGVCEQDELDLFVALDDKLAE
jgi:hypothetical protein